MSYCSCFSIIDFQLVIFVVNWSLFFILIVGYFNSFFILFFKKMFLNQLAPFWLHILTGVKGHSRKPEPACQKSQFVVFLICLFVCF